MGEFSHWRRAILIDEHLVGRLLAEFGRELDPEDLTLGDKLQVWITDEGTAMFVLCIARDLGRWTGHFTSVTVHPDHRGEGLAREAFGLATLLCRKYAKDKGVSMRWFGYTSPKRKASIHLLEEFGWKRLSDGEGTSVWALDV